MRAPPASNRPMIGRARLHRHVLHLDDLLRMRLAERAAEHGEVLGEQIDRAAVDRAPAGDHAVAGDLGLLHAEVGGAVLDEHVELLERALVEQQFDALARGQLAALVLGVDAGLAAAQAGLFAPLSPACRGCLSWPACPCPPVKRLNRAKCVPWGCRPGERKRDPGPSSPGGIYADAGVTGSPLFDALTSFRTR